MLEIKELFQEYKDEKIALYGLGAETKKALLLLEDRFEIIGLLDSFQESGKLYGKEILSLSQAIEKGVKLIIVVARPGSCKAIKKRIGAICGNHGVALIDIRGRNLLEQKQIAYNFANIAGGTREELYQKIARAEVVSFDLFDTLIMREVLSSADIFELMDAELKGKGVYMTDFPAMRLETEKRLAKYGAPTLEALYEDILKKTSEIPLSAKELSEMEWEIDYKTIIARKTMCDVYECCIQQKKNVYIVTDTYYRIEQIKEILEKFHLTGYAGLLVSCEYDTGKRQQLYDRLKEKEGKKKYLHIGNDFTADIEVAEEKGLNTYHVFSGEELLEAVGNMGMGNYMDSLPERLKIGMFVAKLFNNPFQFESEDRWIELADSYGIGYLICAPMITDFVFWLQEQVRRYGIQNIWFCARDGYLLQKMYQILNVDEDTVYFQTSRIAAVRAGMMDDTDISYVDNMNFSGSLEESLKIRFGLEPDSVNQKDCRAQGVIDRKCKTEKELGLLGYKDSILKAAADERQKYKTYINTLKMKAGDIAFFDFVAKGTTQMYVQRFVDHHLKGMYFLRLEPNHVSNKELDIASFYSTEETESSSIYENYYVLETILTAPYPYVCGFDGTGQPIYAEESRTEKDIGCFTQVQEGVLDYFRRYLELLPVNFKGRSKELDEVILGLIHNLKIRDEDFLSLIVEDPFFNRMTSITELI